MIEAENKMIDTSILNKNQKDAVLSDDKYLRIIAGAGSGKTRVLTMRIAHLIEDEDVRPYKILAITFTNKAANEMKLRIEKMLTLQDFHPWVSTIHSLCVRILREDIQHMGYPKNFTIMDGDDQKSVVKEACKQLAISTNNVTPAGYIDYISNNKTAQIGADEAMKMAGSFGDDKDKARVYAYYLERQKQMSALDFDDLILWTVQMFQKFPDVKEKWQRRFEYVLVDEFQDIDRLQYTLIKQLAGKDSSLYVVGDPDQTIYTWRGADVNIIMDFHKDFPHAKTVILNENYRSTSAILNTANSVIANNVNRMKKELYTNRSSDAKVTHYMAISDEYQAAWIAGKIYELHQNGLPYHDMAILYRSNYLSRSLEKGLIDVRIPYIIYGGIRFYERQEVKDALCYLRMCTTADDLALQRIINRPKRGIGPKTIDTLSQQARSEGRSMYEVLKEEDLFTGKTKTTLQAFVQMVETWRTEAAKENADLNKLLDEILESSGINAMLSEDLEKGQERKENLRALAQDLANTQAASLDEYLQNIALYTDRDEENEKDCLQLMTVHAAKGLEFDTVFVSDLNDGIFPNERAMSEGKRGVEEERRLAYVAFTRAKNKLFLTEPGGFSYILQRPLSPSRFIAEIDPTDIQHIGSRQLNQEKEKHEHASMDLFAQNEKMSEAMSHAEHGRPANFKKGDQVSHVKFGDGIVIACKNGIAEIAFPYPYGVKKIAAGHPSLSRKKA
jgi:DNA helicase-2/ATP-dependent DNA helicase PcrA